MHVLVLLSAVLHVVVVAGDGDGDDCWCFLPSRCCCLLAACRLRLARTEFPTRTRSGVYQDSSGSFQRSVSNAD